MAATLAEPTLPSKGRRPWWHWPLIAAGTLLYALVFGELFLRLVSPQALVPRYVTAGPEGVRANMPGVSFRQWTPEVDVTVRYNEVGQRDDRPGVGPRSAGDCRIGLLGDSYFVGVESDYPHSCAARLEDALAKRGHPCRVVNFAVSGFGHAENLKILDSRVRPYKPDLLLMSVHLTDGFDNVRSNLYTTGPNGPEPTGQSFLPGIAISDRLNRLAVYRWAQENSHLYSALREWAGTMGKRLLAMARLSDSQAEAEGEEPTPLADAPSADAAVDAPAGAPAGAPTPSLPGWVGNQALNAQLVAAIHQDSRAIGARLMLFVIPSATDRTHFTGPMGKLLPAPLVDAIPHASPLQKFQEMASPDVQLYLERGHRHWTALGNQTAADVAADAIIAQRLLPGTGGEEAHAVGGAGRAP